CGDDGGRRGADYCGYAAIDLWQKRHGRRRRGRRCDKSHASAKEDGTFLYLADAKRRDFSINDRGRGSHAAADNCGYDCAVRQKIEKTLTEDPMRPADIGFSRSHRGNAAIFQTIEVPRAGAVGAKIERASGGPSGLNNRLWRPPGNEPGPLKRAFTRQSRDVKPRPVPRHVGMVPGDPREPSAILGETGRTQKIGSLN